MSDWNHGYNVALNYTYGYYHETAPGWLDWALRLKNHTPPSSQTWSGAKIRYLDLGCGQGLNLIMHAGAHPDMEFVGIDFNPVHIAHARQLVAQSGLSNVRFLEGDFLQLATLWPAELGCFHYVVLHGIYSWVAPSLRRAIVQCLQAALLPGGAAYVSYNTMPGWSNRVSLQHLLRRVEQTSGQSPVNAIEQGLQLCGRLQEAGARIFAESPSLASFIERSVKPNSRNYVVQEYLHENWHPLWFSQVASELAAAKLLPAATASLAEAFLPHVLPPAFQQIFSDSGMDAVWQQELVDLVINQSFRRDVFVRGAVHPWTGTARQQLLDQTFCYLHPALDSDKRNSIETSFGQLSGDANLYDALREALSGEAMTLAQLMAKPTLAKRSLADLVQALSMLTHARQVAPWRPKPDKAVAVRLNRVLAEAVCEGAPYGFAIAAHTGLAVAVNDLSFMLLDTCAKHPTKVNPATLAQGLRERLQRLGRQLQHEGQPVTPEQLTNKLDAAVHQFIQGNLTQYKRLGVWA